MFVFVLCICHLLVHGIHEIALPGHQALHFGDEKGELSGDISKNYVYARIPDFLAAGWDGARAALYNALCKFLLLLRLCCSLFGFYATILRRFRWQLKCNGNAATVAATSTSMSKLAAAAAEQKC